MRAADAGVVWVELERASVGAHWESVEDEDGTESQTGAGVGEGEEVRALGPRREAGRRACEAWGEPLSVRGGWRMPGPGQDCWSRCGVGTGAGPTKPGAMWGDEGSR